MARDSNSSGNVYLKAVNSTKSHGKWGGPGTVKKTASGPIATHTLSAPDLKTLIKEIDACKQVVKSAQHQIEILVERNAGLQHELIELTRQEAQARHLAYHDGLTGLPNRSLLRDRFHQAMSQAERHHNPLALLMLDLNEFKRVNDQLGHASGDKVLQTVARRLTKGIRGADTACRYGGDEFVIMLAEIDSPHSTATFAMEIGERLSEPYIIDGHEIQMTASVGVAVYPNDGQTFDDLMKQADIAMYRAKGTGPRASITKQPQEYVGQAVLYKPTPKNADRLRERDLFIQHELVHARDQQKKFQKM